MSNHHLSLSLAQREVQSNESASRSHGKIKESHDARTLSLSKRAILHKSHRAKPSLDQTACAATTLQNQAWMVMGEFARTDDEPAFNRVTPKRPFDLSKPGYWGAWTIAARYSERRLDAATFGLNYGDATPYARSAKGFSAE